MGSPHPTFQPRHSCPGAPLTPSAWGPPPGTSVPQKAGDNVFLQNVPFRTIVSVG